MTNAQKNSPMLKVAGLWQKSSVKGGQYLVGRWGGLRVLVMENRDRQTDDDPSHILYVTEATDRRQGGQERPQERFGNPPRTHQTASATQHSGFRGQRVSDHQAPLDHDDMPAAPEWAR
jgi:hypothetical protein